MKEMSDDRYDINKLPISPETRKGLSKENINHLSAVGRMLSLQDLVYEEQFQQISATQQIILDTVNALRSQISELRSEVKELRKEIMVLKDDTEANKLEISKLWGTVNSIKGDVEKVKNRTNWWVWVLRGLFWVALGFSIVLLWHHFLMEGK